MGEVPEGPQTCEECNTNWPAFLLVRIPLRGCPACNDAFARWPMTDADTNADAARSASARVTDADREPERGRDAVLTAGAE